MSEPRILCKYDELVPVGYLEPYLRNRNVHTPEQIERIAKLIAYYGMRSPITLVNDTPVIAKGHGTWEALKLLKWERAPIVRQHFRDDDEVYGYVQSDNAASEWSVLDRSAINSDLKDIGPMDIELLGMKDFVIEPLEKLSPDEAPNGKRTRTCPECGFEF